MKLDGEEYYAQGIFYSAELVANLDKNAVAVQNSVYGYVIYNSDTVDRPFAVASDNDSDWAVYFDRDGVKKMYFV